MQNEKRNEGRFKQLWIYIFGPFYSYGYCFFMRVKNIEDAKKISRSRDSKKGLSNYSGIKWRYAQIDSSSYLKWESKEGTYCVKKYYHPDYRWDSIIPTKGETGNRNQRPILHNLHGPAMMFSDTGNVFYYINNTEYDLEEWEKHPLVREARVEELIEEVLSEWP